MKWATSFRVIIRLILLTTIWATSSFAQEAPENNSDIRESRDLTLTELRVGKNIAKEFRQRLKTKLDLEAALQGLAVEDWQQRSAQFGGIITSALVREDLPEEVKNKIIRDARFTELNSAVLLLGFQGSLYPSMIDKPEKSDWEFPDEVKAIRDLVILGNDDDSQAGKINNVERLQSVLFAHRRAVELAGKALAQLKIDKPDKYEEAMNTIFQLKKENFWPDELSEDEVGLKKGTRIIYATIFPYDMAIAKIKGQYKIVALTFYAE